MEVQSFIKIPKLLKNITGCHRQTQTDTDKPSLLYKG